jgi:hypothetical protein
LVTSSDGISFALTSSSQSPGNRNSFSSLTYNPVTGYIWAWNTKGYGSTSLLSAVTSTWTRSTLRVANTAVTGSALGASTYVITLSDKTIYTTTDPSSSGSYTNVVANTNNTNCIIKHGVV